MKKYKSFRIEARSYDEIVRLTALVSLGMCVAARENVVSPRYAFEALFSPMLLIELRRRGVDPVLCEILDRAMEVEDVASLVPDRLPGLLDELVADLTAYIDSLRDKEPAVNRCWIARWR